LYSEITIYHRLVKVIMMVLVNTRYGKLLEPLQLLLVDIYLFIRSQVLNGKFKCYFIFEGYYEEFKLDGFVFHDGGVLANNPTAIAIHEAKLLWPKTDINCVVSVGNGRYKPEGYASSKANSVSLKQKINRFVAGISSTESKL